MPPTIGELEKRLPTHEQIAERANQIYLARGGQPGHEMDDWLQAEYELLALPIHKLAELNAPKKSKRPAVKKSTLVALVQIALALGSTRLK
jgi:hypothetical protein